MEERCNGGTIESADEPHTIGDAGSRRYGTQPHGLGVVGELARVRPAGDDELGIGQLGHRDDRVVHALAGHEASDRHEPVHARRRRWQRGPVGVGRPGTKQADIDAARHDAQSLG